MTQPLDSLYRAQAAARVIVSIFETGQKRGNPAAIVVLRDGAGLSYGMHQATHKARSLANVLLAYATLQPEKAKEAMSFVQQLEDRSEANVSRQKENQALRAFLKSAGLHDPLMRRAQEEVFDRDYLFPATKEWQRRGFVEPLTLAIVYDAFIQGSWHLCRERANEHHAAPVGERVWLDSYLTEREAFLLGLRTQDQRNSVYRPRELRKLVDAENWKLVTPFTVRGITINEDDLR